jgi:hypothetical protein
MAVIGRNAPCPCGSGKKYKKCCAARPVSSEPSKEIGIEELKPAIRMRGGVRFDPYSGGYIAVVHSWDNIECRGEPKEWRDPRVFATEDEAMNHYKTTIRPSLEKLMNQLKKRPGVTSTSHRKLEE